MWSMMRRPGESKTDKLAICARCLFDEWTDLINLKSR